MQTLWVRALEYGYGVVEEGGRLIAQGLTQAEATQLSALPGLLGAVEAFVTGRAADEVATLMRAAHVQAGGTLPAAAATSEAPGQPTA